MRIRHLAILVAYVAVALAFLVEISNVQGLDRRAALLQNGPMVGPILATLSAFVLRPGPRRDAITAFWFWSFLFVYAIYCVMAVIITVWAGAQFGRPGGLAGKLYFSFLLLGALLLSLGMSLAGPYIIPRTCPGCRRKALVGALLERSHDRRRKTLYVRCKVCEQMSLILIPRNWSRTTLKVKDGHICCPHCGRATLRAIRYHHFWCLACASRFRKTRRGDWEGADGPADNDFYWLWTPRSWLTGLARRWTRRPPQSESLP